MWRARHLWWRFYFTPTSASWLNAVEAFFAKLTKHRLKRDMSFVATDLGAVRPLQVERDPHNRPLAVRCGYQTLDFGSSMVCRAAAICRLL